MEQANVNLHEAALEAYCLRVLFLNPKLIYDVNRKFRELAGDRAALADGALGDLSPDDFTRTSYRLLMDIFLRAIGQDEQDVSDFFQSALTPDLLDELAILLADEWEDLRPRLRHGLSADLMIVIKQAERFSGAVDMSAELVEKALRLRVQRLAARTAGDGVFGNGWRCPLPKAHYVIYTGETLDRRRIEPSRAIAAAVVQVFG